MRDHDAGAAGFEGAGIGGLVIVGGMGIGHEDRWPPDGRQLGHGRGAGAADHEMGGGQPLRQIGEERRQLDDDAAARIALADLVEILGPALLDEAQAAAQGGRQRQDGLGHDLTERGGALAAAEHHEVDHPALARRAIGLAAQRLDLLADGVADEARAAIVGGDVARRLERGRDPRRAAQHHAVGLAQHGVLLVQQRRQAAQAGGDHGRHRGVAAEADDRRRRDAAQRPPGVEQAAAERQHGLQPLHRRAAGARRMDVVDRPVRQRALPLPAARIGDQRERHAARLELAGQRLGGEHVPAGAAGRQNHGTRLDHQTASLKPACSRVSDSSMPTQIAIASADEPP